MYGAEQGSTSGAHIDISTTSGTNDIHGSGYLHRGTNWLVDSPYFYKLNGNIPAEDKVPGLRREVPGGDVGFPIIKNKLFMFLSYQHIHDSDQEIGSSRMAVRTPDERPQPGRTGSEQPSKRRVRARLCRSQIRQFRLCQRHALTLSGRARRRMASSTFPQPWARASARSILSLTGC